MTEAIDRMIRAEFPNVMCVRVGGGVDGAALHGVLTALEGR